jgi:transposase
MKKEMRQRRTFSTEFKKEKVDLIDSGKITAREISEVYSVSKTSIYKWVKKYSKLPRTERIVVEKISEETKNKELLTRIKDLECVIGRKQLEVDYYKTTLDLIEEQEGGDLVKKYKPKS